MWLNDPTNLDKLAAIKTEANTGSAMARAADRPKPKAASKPKAEAANRPKAKDEANQRRRLPADQRQRLPADHRQRQSQLRKIYLKNKTEKV